VVDIQEIKGQLLNVYNSRNFLKNIDVPVDSYNKNIKKTIELLKEGDLAQAKKEVLHIRKETGEILTRMDNIHNGLLQIEKEIAKMVKKGMNTVALRRLYSQCRLALKDKDYDQVQLFIIKMDKIIEMYNFLMGPSLLVNVNEGEMIEEIITRMEVEAARSRNQVNEEISISTLGRYTETDEDLPILIPLYDETDDEVGIVDYKDQAEFKSMDYISKGLVEDSEHFLKHPSMEDKENFYEDEKEREGASREKVDVEWGKQEVYKETRTDEMQSRYNRINAMISENYVVDDDLVKGALMLEKLVYNNDLVGANELAEELERLLSDYILRRDMEKITNQYKEARRCLLTLSERKIDTNNIRILYDRAVKLRDRGELDIATRLFREVIGMCNESELSAFREKELNRIKELKEKMDRIPSQLLERATIDDELDLIKNKLNEDQDIGGRMEELASKIQKAYNVYMQENLEALDKLFRERMENLEKKNIPVNSLYIIREKAKASLEKENWDEAGEQYKRGLDEIELALKIADHKIELDRFEKDLDLLDKSEAIYMETRKYLGECRNMILRRDENNFCILFQKAREIAGKDITRIKSDSHLTRLDVCIGELSNGEMRNSYTKRYSEAKSKSDEGRYAECLELTTSLINEITVIALESISQK
jgi:hypothetical protein